MPSPVPGILHPIAVRQDLSLWAWTADRPAMGHIRAANLRHPHLVNLEAELPTTTAEKNEAFFWQILVSELPRMAPDGAWAAVAALERDVPLIAQ